MRDPPYGERGGGSSNLLIGLQPYRNHLKNAVSDLASGLLDRMGKWDNREVAHINMGHTESK